MSRVSTAGKPKLKAALRGVLTDVVIRQAKPAEKPYKLSDGGGMFLLINSNGSKYWRLKYRIDGKEKKMALGVYPEVSLTQARDKRDKARELIGGGIDPIEHIRKQERARKQQSENSFEIVAREWHSKRAPKWSEGHATRILVSLEKDVFPFISDKPINKIDAPEILMVLRHIESRDALDYLGRVRQRLSAVFRYAIQTGRASHNAAADLSDAFKTRQTEHRAALSRADLPGFIRSVNDYQGYPVTRLAMRFMLLTFVRTKELRGARWEEIDMQNAVWEIPGDRMKMKEPHRVPLSRQALQLLEELRPLSGNEEILFPSPNAHGKSLSENALLYMMYRLGYHSRATTHGIRATAATILSEEGFASDVIERALAHQERNKVKAAYQRSDFFKERQRMMQWWGDYLERASSLRPILPMKKRA
jgi:integrase